MFGICVFLAGPTRSNEFLLIIQTGLLFGGIFFLFLGPVHFLLQFSACILIGRLRRKKGAYVGVMLNIPAFLVLVGLLIQMAIPMSQAALRAVLQAQFSSLSHALSP